LRPADAAAAASTADLQMAEVSDYERVFNAADGLIEIAQTAGQARVATLNRNTAIVLAIPIALAAVLLLVSSLFLQRAFVRPIGQVLRGLNAFARGQLDHQVPEVGSAELVTLERAVNQMAADLAASRAAQIAAERQAAHGALVPVVAHNIRNPLASIRAAAQVLEGSGVSKEVVQGLRDIRATVDRLERWLTALLSYLNPLKLARTEARLAPVADQAIALLQPRLEAKRLRVRRLGWDLEATCLLDIHLMEQAVYGLLANAAEASPEEGTLLLTVRAAGSSVQLVIADRGTGMPFRPMPGDLNPGPTTKSYGSGLGIPFAFKICGLHEGVLEFAARDGGGTEVIVTLPMHRTSARTAA
jgi:signal transduction histidine kinase